MTNAVLLSLSRSTCAPETDTSAFSWPWVLGVTRTVNAESVELMRHLDAADVSSRRALGEMRRLLGVS